MPLMVCAPLNPHPDDDKLFQTRMRPKMCISNGTFPGAELTEQFKKTEFL